jgi:hypothetical protein
MQHESGEFWQGFQSDLARRVAERSQSRPRQLFVRSERASRIAHGLRFIAVKVAKHEPFVMISGVNPHPHPFAFAGSVVAKLDLYKVARGVLGHHFSGDHSSRS